MALERYIYPLKKLLYNWWWSFKMKTWYIIPKDRGSELLNTEFSIGIVTYVDRYNKFFQPLIVNLVTLFPDTEIVIAVNGYHDPLVQNPYLQDIAGFLGQFRNVKLIDFHGPQSLSKLWNLLIVHSSFEKVMILNDDIKISPFFRESLTKSPALKEDVALLNRSWSHFLISKTIIKRVGWFDQRFPGVGNEDEDYESRLVTHHIPVKSFKIVGLKNIVFKTVNFSYGKDMEVVNTKYVKANKLHFDAKWEMETEPAPGFVYVEILRAYVKLREGMDTPNFYNV